MSLSRLVLSKALGLCALLPLAPMTSSFASPLPPIVRASTSANGRFLVYGEWQLDGPEDQPAKLIHAKFRVLQREEFINEAHRVNAPTPFWGPSYSEWTVTLDGSDGFSVPMISDDGNSLLLLLVSAPALDRPMLKLFRKDQYKGKLVRAFDIKSLWTTKELESSQIGMIFDSTPMWYAGATFTFSADQKTLNLRTRWGDAIGINLETGALTRAKE